MYIHTRLILYLNITWVLTVEESRNALMCCGRGFYIIIYSVASIYVAVVVRGVTKAFMDKLFQRNK